MEKEKFFVIGIGSPCVMWHVLTLQTEDFNEAMAWYEKITKENKLYSNIKIAKTIYG